MVDDWIATFLLLAGIAALLWFPARNFRTALRDPATRDRAQGVLLGLLLGVWLS